MRISESPRLTLLQGGVGEEESGNVSSPYGPVRAGLTTSLPINKEVQLSELLNSCERNLETLESRFYEVCVTLNIVTERLVRLGLFGIKLEAHTIDREEESE